MSAVKVRVLDARIQEHLPKYQTSGSAGFDLRAAIDQPLVIEAGQTVLVPTGLSIYLEDPNLVGIIAPRSGLGHKNGIVLGNLVGVIDSDYQGQLMVSVWNRNAKGTAPFTINPLDRIAQYLVMPVVQATFEVVDEFQATERGAGGFGSTGKQ